MSQPVLLLERINDKAYFFKDKNGRLISIQTSTKHSPEYNYNLALKAAKIIFESEANISKQRYLYGEKNWKVEKLHQKKGIIRLLAKIFDFLYPHSDDGIIRYKVSHSWRKAKTTSKKNKLSKIGKEFKKPSDRANFKCYLKQTNQRVTSTTLHNFKHKICASVPITDSVLEFDQPFFDDPFTNLASLAFNKFEPDFTSKDFFTPADCHYRVVKKGNGLHLVHKKTSINKRHSRDAILTYKNFLIKNFGKEKISYIQHHFRINLDTIDALTPEHIYRINIGLTNLEYQDVDAFLNKLNLIAPELQDLNASDPLEQFLVNHPLLTGQEARGLYQYFYQTKSLATIGNLREWLSSFAPLPPSCEQLSPEIFTELLSMIHFTLEEKELALTGRKIFGFIKSGYTTAGMKEFKPWVDQHQLTQFYAELIQNSSTVSYAEKLAHVVSKVSLVHAHPVEEFRVGTLIPAPPLKSDGPLRWYKITSCISNSYGIFSYTLESACDDPSLPAIKLYRNTAISRYALHSQATVVNDLNNFNSPGHQGIGRTDSYEEQFFKDRTIPIWLGYTLQATKTMTSHHEDRLEKTLHHLTMVEKELLRNFRQKHKVKALKEILQSHDFLLNDLERRLHPVSCIAAMIGCTNVYKKWVYAKLFRQLIKFYILKVDLKTESNEVNDARQLIKVLKKISSLEKSTITKRQIRLLVKDLNDHILTNKAQKQREAAWQKFQNNRANLVKLRKDARNALDASEFDDAEKKLQQLIRRYYRLAERKQETLSSKIPGGITFIGHSLGGACASSHAIRWLAEKNRMPVPYSNCSIYVFDDPAINKKSNRLFMHWGARHRELFKAENVGFSLIRRQEASDPVVTAGEEHSGSVYSEEEERVAYEWLEFDAAVLKKHPDSRHIPIALPVMAHEARFLEGTPIRTFFTEEQILEQLDQWQKDESEMAQSATDSIQRMLNRPRDYTATYFSPFIQGIFDREGTFKERSEEENEEFKKQFRALKIELWDLQHFMDPITAEKARKSVSLFWTIVRKLLVGGRDYYLLEEKYLDQKGNFVVSNKGVQSKQTYSPFPKKFKAI